MIFISHSSKDHDAAAALHARFLARDYDPSQLFLDSDAGSGIAAGQQWQQVLYTRLKDCHGLIVLCTQSWLDSKWCFAELIYAKASGKEIFPVILEPCDCRGVLDEYQAVLVYREGEAAWERLWRALDTRHLGPRDDFGWPPKDGDACPFPGLLSFDERHAGVYFGREPERQAMLEELRKMRANGEPRLLMITGGSGSGKSSLLKAGVLPQLTHKSSGTEWLVLPVLRYGQAASPQHTVLDQLAMNVASDWRVLRDALRGADGAKAFVDATRDLAAARGSPGATVLLPIDQFEELLAPAAGPDAVALLRLLHEVFGCANGRLLAVATVRSDHLDVYERHPHALAAPYFQPWRLGPFPRDRVRDVIVKPAARAGVEVTPDLLARLERDTPSSESLPLLAFTLEKLYRRYAADRKLELQEYEDLGGIEGAIQKSADAIALAPEVHDAVRLTFVRHLASVNDKDEVVRVTARWSDIPDAATPVLEKFVAERLLVKNDHDDAGGRWVSVEVAHEALFRAWPALAQWLKDAADILRWRRDVQRDRAADPQWRALRPSQLAVARPWLRHRRNELTAEELGWIRKSIRRERTRWAVAAAVAALILGFGVYAFIQKRVADRESQVALGRFLASQSMEVAASIPRYYGQALLLAIEGYRRAPSAATALPLRVAMAATPVPVARLGHERVVVSAVAFNRQGNLLATGDEKGTLRVWDFLTGKELAKTTLGGSVDEIFWQPDGERIAARTANQNGGDARLALWKWRTNLPSEREDLPELSQLLSAEHPDRWVMRIAGGNLERWGNGAPLSVKLGGTFRDRVAVTPSGDRLAITSGARGKYRVDIVDTMSGRLLAEPLATDQRPLAVAFRPDGEAVAIATDDGTTHVWNWRGNVFEATHKGVSDPSAIVFSPDGRLIAEPGPRGGPALRVWNAATGSPVVSLNSNWDVASRFQRVRFSADGRHLIVCLSDSAVRVYFIAPDERERLVLRFTPGEPVRAMDVDRTATFAAVGSTDGWVTVWRLTPGHSARHFSGDEGPVASPAGDTIALRGRDGRIVDVKSGETLLRLGPILAHDLAVFSADGRQFAGVDASQRIVIADLRTRRTRLVPRGEAVAIQFSPDGTQLFVAHRDGRLTVLANDDERLVLRTRIGTVNEFSADARFFAVEDGGRVYLYDVAQEKKLAEVVSNAFFSTPVLSPDGTLLAFNPDDTTLAIWSMESQGEVFRMPVEHAMISTPVFDPSGRQIAFKIRNEVHVYDVRRKKKTATLLQVGGQIVTLAFSPDGAHLAAGCTDKNIRIWRIAGGEVHMAIPQEHSFGFSGTGGDRGGGTIQFTSDGRFLVVAQGWEDGPYGNFVRLVLWRPEDVVSEACRRSVRKALTPAEWQQFLNGQPYRVTCDAGLTAAH